jgi:hypothetical protein
MSNENNKDTSELDVRPLDIDGLLARKGPELASGTQKHIRRLKSEGRLNEALGIANRERRRKAGLELKPGQEVEEAIVSCVESILSEEANPQQRALSEIRFVWLLSSAEREMTVAERISTVEEILATKDLQMQDFLQKLIPIIRDEVQKLVGFSS